MTLLGELKLGEIITTQARFTPTCYYYAHSNSTYTSIQRNAAFAPRWRVVDKSRKNNLGEPVVTLLATAPVGRGKYIKNASDVAANYDSTNAYTEFFYQDSLAELKGRFFLDYRDEFVPEGESEHLYFFKRMQPMTIHTGDGKNYLNQRIYIPSQAELGLGDEATMTGAQGTVFQYFSNDEYEGLGLLEHMEFLGCFADYTKGNSTSGYPDPVLNNNLRFATRTGHGAFGQHMKYFLFDPHNKMPVLGNSSTPLTHNDQQLYFFLPVINLSPDELVTDERIFGARVLFQEKLDTIPASVFVKRTDRLWITPTQIQLFTPGG